MRAELAKYREKAELVDLLKKYNAAQYREAVRMQAKLETLEKENADLKQAAKQADHTYQQLKQTVEDELKREGGRWYEKVETLTAQLQVKFLKSQRAMKHTLRIDGSAKVWKFLPGQGNAQLDSECQDGEVGARLHGAV